MVVAAVMGIARRCRLDAWVLGYSSICNAGFAGPHDIEEVKMGKQTVAFEALASGTWRRRGLTAWWTRSVGGRHTTRHDSSYYQNGYMANTDYNKRLTPFLVKP